MSNNIINHDLNYRNLILMYITNNPDIALIAQKYGVDRIWVDLETIDKSERQRGRNAVMSNHSVDDIKRIKPLLSTSQMLVRINHWHDGSNKEIDAAIDAGADILMLPYWKTIDEVSGFINAVDGRCKTTLLLETKEAVDCIDEVLALGGFDEVHIGLNDLHISYGLDFMFELLSNGMVEMLCEKFADKGIPYGFGGIAKIGDGLIPAEKIIMEHYRLGSTRAILSRTFCDNAKIESIEEIDRVFDQNMKKLREFEQDIRDASKEDYLKNRDQVYLDIKKVTESRRQNGVGNNV